MSKSKNHSLILRVNVYIYNEFWKHEIVNFGHENHFDSCLGYQTPQLCCDDKVQDKTNKPHSCCRRQLTNGSDLTTAIGFVDFRKLKLMAGRTKK